MFFLQAKIRISYPVSNNFQNILPPYGKRGSCCDNALLPFTRFNHWIAAILEHHLKMFKELNTGTHFISFFKPDIDPMSLCCQTAEHG